MISSSPNLLVPKLLVPIASLPPALPAPCVYVHVVSMSKSRRRRGDKAVIFCCDHRGPRQMIPAASKSRLLLYSLLLPLPLSIDAPFLQPFGSPLFVRLWARSFLL